MPANTVVPEKSGLQKFLGRYFTEDGVESISKKAPSIKGGAGSMLKAGLGKMGLMTMGITAYRTSRMMDEGHTLSSALPRSLARGMMYATFPKIMIGRIGAQFMSQAPDIQNAAEQQKFMETNFNTLGGDYVDQQANFAARSRAMEHIKRTRSTIAASVGGEARRYHRT